MPITSTIQISSDLLAHVVSATEEVFEMMVFHKVEPLEPLGTEPPRAVSNVVAAVGFAGHRRGFVALHCSLESARSVTGKMLGMETGEITNEVPDAVGEVANMIAGTFRNKLAAIEPASAIGVPTVTIGSDFATYCGASTRRAFCPFIFEGQQIFVELVLSPN